LDLVLGKKLKFNIERGEGLTREFLE